MKKLILVVLIIFTALQGGDRERYFGLGLNLGSRGSGFLLHQAWKMRPNLSCGVEVRFYDIKAENEFLVRDYYTGQPYTVNNQSLVILPVFASLYYYPFEGKIDNTFSPYITLKAGPILTINGDESINNYFDRWRKAQTYITIGGFLGVGFDFRWLNRSVFSLGIGMDILPMDGNVDGENQYNGVLLSITYSQLK